MINANILFHHRYSCCTCELKTKKQTPENIMNTFQEYGFNSLGQYAPVQPP